jgi:hypothetical protein
MDNFARVSDVLEGRVQGHDTELVVLAREDRPGCQRTLRRYGSCVAHCVRVTADRRLADDAGRGVRQALAASVLRRVAAIAPWLKRIAINAAVIPSSESAVGSRSTRRPFHGWSLSSPPGRPPPLGGSRRRAALGAKACGRRPSLLARPAAREIAGVPAFPSEQWRRLARQGKLRAVWRKSVSSARAPHVRCRQSDPLPDEEATIGPARSLEPSGREGRRRSSPSSARRSSSRSLGVGAGSLNAPSGTAARSRPTGRASAWVVRASRTPRSRTADYRGHGQRPFARTTSF